MASEIVARGLHAESPNSVGAAPTPRPTRWPEEAFRRPSVDIHVPDWDPALLSRFNAAEFVETLFHQPERKRLLAGLLNLQQQLPQAPVPATVRVLPPEGQKIRRVLRLPSQAPMPFSQSGPYVRFHVEPFDPIAMFALDY